MLSRTADFRMRVVHSIETYPYASGQTVWWTLGAEKKVTVKVVY
jgi:membrane-bound inhibitor of C-type lysozyme